MKRRRSSCPAACTLRRWPVSQGHKIQCDAKQLTRPFGDNVAATLAASRRIGASDPRAPSIGRRSGVNSAAPGGAPNLALRVQLLGAMIGFGPPAGARLPPRSRARRCRVRRRKRRRRRREAEEGNAMIENGAGYAAGMSMQHIKSRSTAKMRIAACQGRQESDAVTALLYTPE